MSNTRLEKLKEMLIIEPDDLFLKYAMAMELQGVADVENAQKIFEEIINIDKNHVASFYQLGKIFENKGQDEKAIEIFERGLDAAKAKNDQRASREIKAALDELNF
ncbi:MAG: tetratricopeptide repeat protein [Bacteroidota bacterium]